MKNKKRSEEYAFARADQSADVSSKLRRAPADVVDIIISEIQSLCVRENLSNQETEELIKKVKDRNVGYLFENMEKMDIQLERRRTEEQRQKAEEQRQKAEKVFRMLISSYKMQGMEKEDARKQLIEGTGVEDKEIDELLEKYWGI